MKKIDSSFYKLLLMKKNLNKKFLETISKKYKISKSKIFSFLSFSEELFNKTHFAKIKCSRVSDRAMTMQKDEKNINRKI